MLKTSSVPSFVGPAAVGGGQGDGRRVELGFRSVGRAWPRWYRIRALSPALGGNGRCGWAGRTSHHSCGVYPLYSCELWTPHRERIPIGPKSKKSDYLSTISATGRSTLMDSGPGRNRPRAAVRPIPNNAEQRQLSRYKRLFIQSRSRRLHWQLGAGLITYQPQPHFAMLNKTTSTHWRMKLLVSMDSCRGLVHH